MFMWATFGLWAAASSDTCVSKEFFQGDTSGFFQKCFLGAKSGEIWFFLLETKKTVFAKNFKIQGSSTPALSF